MNHSSNRKRVKKHKKCFLRLNRNEKYHPWICSSTPVGSYKRQSYAAQLQSNILSTLTGQLSSMSIGLRANTSTLTGQSATNGLNSAAATAAVSLQLPSPNSSQHPHGMGITPSPTPNKLAIISRKGRNLTSIPFSLLADASAIHEIYLDRNKLTKCHFDNRDEETQTFHRLQVLHVSNNHLKDLPTFVHYPYQLRWLSVSSNLIQSISGKILLNYCHLLELDLSNNLMKALPVEIGQLVMLENLYIHNNELVELPRDIIKCQALKHFTAHNNQLRIPYQILVDTGGFDAVKTFFNSVLHDNYIHDIQIVLLGPKDSGKSHLKHLLQYNHIYISHLKLDYKLQLNIYDFTNLSTHYTFLKSNSLYIIVWDMFKSSKSELNDNIQYWIDLVQTILPKSTFVIVGRNFHQFCDKYKNSKRSQVEIVEKLQKDVFRDLDRLEQDRVNDIKEKTYDKTLLNRLLDNRPKVYRHIIPMDLIASYDPEHHPVVDTALLLSSPTGLGSNPPPLVMDPIFTFQEDDISPAAVIPLPSSGSYDGPVVSSPTNVINTSISGMPVNITTIPVASSQPATPVHGSLSLSSSINPLGNGSFLGDISTSLPSSSLLPIPGPLSIPYSSGDNQRLANDSSSHLTIDAIRNEQLCELLKVIVNEVPQKTADPYENYRDYLDLRLHQIHACHDPPYCTLKEFIDDYLMKHPSSFSSDGSSPSSSVYEQCNNLVHAVDYWVSNGIIMKFNFNHFDDKYYICDETFEEEDVQDSPEDIYLILDVDWLRDCLSGLQSIQKLHDHIVKQNDDNINAIVRWTDIRDHFRLESNHLTQYDLQHEIFGLLKKILLKLNIIMSPFMQITLIAENDDEIDTYYYIVPALLPDCPSKFSTSSASSLHAGHVQIMKYFILPKYMDFHDFLIRVLIRIYDCYCDMFENNRFYAWKTNFTHEFNHITFHVHMKNRNCLSVLCIGHYRLLPLMVREVRQYVRLISSLLSSYAGIYYDLRHVCPMCLLKHRHGYAEYGHYREQDDYSDDEEESDSEGEEGEKVERDGQEIERFSDGGSKEIHDSPSTATDDTANGLDGADDEEEEECEEGFNVCLENGCIIPSVFYHVDSNPQQANERLDEFVKSLTVTVLREKFNIGYLGQIDTLPENFVNLVTIKFCLQKSSNIFGNDTQQQLPVKDPFHDRSRYNHVGCDILPSMYVGYCCHDPSSDQYYIVTSFPLQPEHLDYYQSMYFLVEFHDSSSSSGSSGSSHPPQEDFMCLCELVSSKIYHNYQTLRIVTFMDYSPRLYQSNLYIFAIPREPILFTRGSSSLTTNLLWNLEDIDIFDYRQCDLVGDTVVIITSIRLQSSHAGKVDLTSQQQQFDWGNDDGDHVKVYGRITRQFEASTGNPTDQFNLCVVDVNYHDCRPGSPVFKYCEIEGGVCYKYLGLILHKPHETQGDHRYYIGLPLPLPQ